MCPDGLCNLFLSDFSGSLKSWNNVREDILLSDLLIDPKLGKALKNLLIDTGKQNSNTALASSLTKASKVVHTC